MSDIKAVGFIGLGVMGEAMCRNLAKKGGKPVIGFDTRPEPLDRLEPDGVKRAASIAELMDQVDIVFICVPGEPESRAVCLGEGGVVESARAGQIVVDMSTVPPAVGRDVADACAKKSVDFLDAPIARARFAAIDGTLCIMVGGDKDVLERARPFLDTMGTDIMHCGGVGTGQVMKLMNNMIVFENLNAVAEGFTIAKRYGMDGKLFLETLAQGSGDSFVCRNHAIKSMAPDDHPENAFPVTYAIKDVSYAIQLAEEMGVDARGAKLVLDLLKHAEKAGYGAKYSTIIQRILDGRI
jgi:3-hydroxyisobutyrate dehydrogenase-like beta-hydroxyacid dehydrogenase